MTSPLQKATLNSYRLDMALYEPITTSIACSFNCICAFKKEQKALDKTIDATVAGLNPTEFKSSNPFRKLDLFMRQGSLLRYGLSAVLTATTPWRNTSAIIWRDNQFGEFDSEDTPMMKAENRFPRYYLIQATGSVVTYCPEYTDYYNKKYAEVPKHQHKRALALTARKLIRLIFGLLNKN